MDDFFADGLSAETKGKYIELIRDIDSLGSVAVALSGGVDSSLLAKICHDRLGNQAIAATIVSPMLAKRELEDALAAPTTDLKALALGSALEFLGEISGMTAGEEVIDGIFSRFCVGK